VIVLDANVLVKLFVQEELSNVAEAVVAEHPLLLAPGIVTVEVASALTRKVRHGHLSAEDAEAKVRLWREFVQLGNLRLTPDSELLEEAASLSVQLLHPLADCLYLLVATRTRSPLVTADKPFLDALNGRFPDVRHLSSFSH
jgi:predicted nucleic acid-binding protein